MIKYTSKDIVNRAEQLADLQNSDFISDSEKSALLNEAWNALYQKIINANDRTFIKSASVSDGYRLPSDFYQLSSLYVTKDHQQINRMNAAQMRGYSITNNTLYLSREYNDIEVTLEYFPNPKTIFYNSGKKEYLTDDFFDGIPPKMWLGGDLYINNNDSVVDINDIEQEKFDNFALTNFLIAKNGCVKDVSHQIFALIPYSENYNPGPAKSTPWLIKGNDVTYDNIVSDEDLFDYIACVMDKTQQICYFIGRNGKLFDKNFNEIKNDGTSFDFLNTPFFCRSDGIYIKAFNIDIQRKEHNYLYRVLGDVVEVFSFGMDSFCCFLDDEYCVVKDGITGKYYKQAYGFNTLFDYPNNIYFTLLAYSLAVSFKMKQQGDVTLLNGELEKCMNQFFDSINRDDNQSYVMKNVYANGRGHIWL